MKYLFPTFPRPPHTRRNNSDDLRYHLTNQTNGGCGDVFARRPELAPLNLLTLLSVILFLPHPGLSQSHSDGATSTRSVVCMPDAPNLDPDFIYCANGQEVIFTGSEEDNASAWNWDFGDGSTSTKIGPIHTYTSPGAHTVELEIIYPGIHIETTCTVTKTVIVEDFRFNLSGSTFSPESNGAAVDVIAPSESDCSWRVEKEAIGEDFITITGGTIGAGQRSTVAYNVAANHSAHTRSEFLNIQDVASAAPQIRSVEIGSWKYDPDAELRERILRVTGSTFDPFLISQLGRGRILIDKETNPPGDPTRFDFQLTGPSGLNQSFSLSDADPPRNSGLLLPGSGYAVTETPLPEGWLMEGSQCSNGSPVTNINVSPGETVICTFTNTLVLGRILIDKATIPSGDTTSFEFSLDGGPSHLSQSFSLTDASVPHDSGLVEPGVGYNVTETVIPEGWTLTDAICDDGSDIENIEVSARETVTCTFTNTFDFGRIRVGKLTHPFGDPTNFRFTLAGGPLDVNLPIDLTDGMLYESEPLEPGNGYNVTETIVPEDWTLTNALCDDGSPVANINVSAGEIVTCTFVNTAVTPACAAKVINGFVAWWPFDEQSPTDPPSATEGPISADITRKNDGWQVSGPTSVEGKVDQALSFDGIDDYVEAPDHPSLNFGPSPTGDLSIAFWINTEEMAEDDMVLVDKRGAPETGYELHLAGGVLGLRLNGDVFDSEIFVADGGWHFVAVTVDRDDLSGGRWYLDGVWSGTDFDPMLQPGSLESSAPLRIGRRSFDDPAAGPNPGGHFRGLFDELSLFDRVLTPVEVFEIYEADSLGRCKETIYVAADTPICSDQSEGVGKVTICNHSAQERSYTVAFRGLPAAICDADVDGPTLFDILLPDANPVTVAPRSCRTLGVSIGRPEGMTAEGLSACYQVEVRDVATGLTFTRDASLWDNRSWCSQPRDLTPISVRSGEKVTVAWEVTNSSDTTALLDYKLTSTPDGSETPDVVSLNDRPPGEGVMDTIEIPAGEMAEVSVEAEILAHLPFSFHHLGLEDSSTSTSLSSAGIYSRASGTENLLLNDRRFRVELEWRVFDDTRGSGTAVPFRSEEAGIFWFFTPDNWEMLIKVLDGCGINDRFWVFAAATTNVEYNLTVTDTLTDISKTYSNTLGQNAAAITDTDAFATCSGARASSESAGPPSKEGTTLRAFSRGPVISTTGAGALKLGNCTPDSTRLCLIDSRFSVEVEWETAQGQTGAGQVDPIGSDISGLLWFFNQDNWELLIKMFDRCDEDNRFWVFAAATTDVGYTLRVTDTETGIFNEYTNPLGNAADAIIDLDAFATCP